MATSDLEFDQDFMATMLGDFLDESRGYLSRLNDNLLLLDELVGGSDATLRNIDVALLNEMFRDAHSLKGLSAMLQLNEINGLTHKIENVFDAARSESLTINRDIVDLMFQALDRLTAMVESLKDDEGQEVECQQVVGAIQQLLAGAGVRPQQCTRSELAEIVAEQPSQQQPAREPPAGGGHPADQAAAPTAAENELLGEQDRPEVTDAAEVPAKYLTIFVDETEDALDALAEALLGDEPVKVDPLLGLCHQIKGGAASIGLDRCAELAHSMEDVLHELKESSADWTDEIADALLLAVDGLRGQARSLKSGQREVEDFRSVLQVLHAARAGMSAEAARTVQAVKAENDQRITPETSANNAGRVPQHEAVPRTPRSAPNARTTSGGLNGRPTETVRVDIERLDQLMNLAGQLVINKARFGQLGEQLKELASSKQSTQCLANVSSLLEKILTDVNAIDRGAQESSLARSVRGHAQQIKADLEFIQTDFAKLQCARSLVKEHAEAVHQLDRVTDGIQKSVMETRMVPIGPLFGRFKRVIRDITRVNGRQVSLCIRGEKTELDKRMIDALGDPLIHLVHNAADHGIELPADRQAAGKSRQGTVTLDAFHRGNRILIRVSDDGKGLDPEAIRQRAVARGCVAEVDAERLSLQQTLQLLWEPGFSTADQVTALSGRGMGMDIVRSKIEQLNGIVELESRPGLGTTITIKLPLTMAILPSLLTVISGNVFAVPVESVVEIVRVSPEDMKSVQGLKTACVRGRVVSVFELGELFRWNKRPLVTAHDSQERTLVIIGADGNELGLALDDLLGEEDIVIKSLAENYRNVYGLAGASILGDGRVSLILDVAALVEMACRQCSRPQGDVGTDRRMGAG